VLFRARGHAIEPLPEIDSAGMRMTRNGRHLDIDVHPDALTEVFGVSGAAAMFRTSFLRDVAVDGEVFDEDFFAYREDADIAWRGRLFGWRAVCEPRAVAYHVRRVTPEVRGELPASLNMHSVKNRFLLRLKNEGAYLALRNAPFELARDLMVLIAALTIERTSLPAFGWLWRNRARVLAKRRAIQSRRKVSDRALARWFR
jgi:GT2 family glycosyltransferase